MKNTRGLRRGRVAIFWNSNLRQVVPTLRCHRERFTADHAKDGTELFESIREWMNYQEPGCKTPAMDETIPLAHERRKVEGTIGQRHLQIRELAEVLALTPDSVS